MTGDGDDVSELSDSLSDDHLPKEPSSPPKNRRTKLGSSGKLVNKSKLLLDKGWRALRQKPAKSAGKH